MPVTRRGFFAAVAAIALGRDRFTVADIRRNVVTLRNNAFPAVPDGARVVDVDAGLEYVHVRRTWMRTPDGAVDISVNPRAALAWEPWA